MFRRCASRVGRAISKAYRAGSTVDAAGSLFSLFGLSQFPGSSQRRVRHRTCTESAVDRRHVPVSVAGGRTYRKHLVDSTQFLVGKCDVVGGHVLL